MTSSPVTTHPIHLNATLDDCLDVPEHEVATVLLAVKDTEEVYLDETEIIAFVEEKNYTRHMRVRATSNILRPSVSICGTDAGPELVRTSFLPIKWRDYVRPMHNMSTKSTLNSPVHVLGRVTLLVQ